MLMFIVLICILFVVVPFLIQLTFAGVVIVVPIVLSAVFITHHLRKKDFVEMENKMSILTCKEGLKKLSLDEKRRLARVVDEYLHNFAKFKQSAKDNLMWTGIGYAAGTMGFDRAMRLGIGYTVLRKYLRPSIKNTLEKPEEDF